MRAVSRTDSALSAPARGMKRAGAGCTALTLLLAAVYAATAWRGLLPFVITAGTTAYHLEMRLIVGAVFDRLIGNHADLTRRWYQPRRWEAPLYRRLRVKAWKAHLPTFTPGIFDPARHSWHEIAQAMCQSELVHETNAVLSFAPLLLVPLFGELPVFALTSLGAACLDLVFVITQRYNRARLLPLIAKRQAAEK